MFVLTGCFSFSSIINNNYYKISGPTEVMVGETISLTVTDEDGKEVLDIIWSSANNEIATVENGVVTGVSAGKVSIVVRSSDDEDKVGRTYINVIKEKIEYTDEQPTKIEVIKCLSVKRKY